MLARLGLNPQEALVCTMVLVAATDGGITDREIGVMSGLVQTLPAFHNFSSEQLDAATEAAIDLLAEDDGLKHAGEMIRVALEPGCARRPMRWPARWLPPTDPLGSRPCGCWSSCWANCISTRWSQRRSSGGRGPGISESRRSGLTSGGLLAAGLEIR
ncbi:MAG: tellurite resistance TerB family protein [Acetobacteraceae bacterium]